MSILVDIFDCHLKSIPPFPHSRSTPDTVFREPPVSPIISHVFYVRPDYLLSHHPDHNN